VYCRFPLVDGAGNDGTLLFLAITTVRTLLERRVQTLVCCSMGVSRAPAVAAAALAMLSGESPERCLVQIAEHHPSDVSPGLWDDLLGLLQGSAS
jgi:protein-tyrosine phosphatase